MLSETRRGRPARPSKPGPSPGPSHPYHRALLVPCIRCAVMNLKAWPSLGAPRWVCTRLAQGRPASSPFPSPQRGGPSGAREHSVHFISDYRFLNIIKSLACSGGSVSQSVGSYFSTSLRKTKGSGAGQTDGQKERGDGGGGEAKGRHARKHTLTHTKKSPRETEGQRCGTGGTGEAITFKRKRNWARGSEVVASSVSYIVVFA